MFSTNTYLDRTPPLLRRRNIPRLEKPEPDERLEHSTPETSPAKVDWTIRPHLRHRLLRAVQPRHTREMIQDALIVIDDLPISIIVDTDDRYTRGYQGRDRPSRIREKGAKDALFGVTQPRAARRA